MTNLEFTLTNDRYISETIVPNGDTAIELTFDKKGAQVFLQQSLSGDNWHTFSADYETNTYYITNVIGVVDEMKLRVVSTLCPTIAKYV